MGEQNRVEIGKNCTIREQVTVNPGTGQGDLATRIGDDCMLLISSHVAHDCQLGNGVTLVNNVALGGHCQIGDYAVLGGATAVHQYVRIGESGFVGGMSGVDFDIIPFGSAIGNRASLGGLNIVGLTRRGFSREDIHQLRRAYRMLFAPEGTLKERLADVEESSRKTSTSARSSTFIRSAGSVRSAPRGAATSLPEPDGRHASR
jgi:UDP-N-acetylglucosamine acyltransferase